MKSHRPPATHGSTLRRRFVTTAFTVIVCTPGLSAEEPANTSPAPAQAAADAVVARVGDQLITRQQFEAAVRLAWRERFYHGQPPPAQQRALRRQVLESLIDRTLLLKEARRRGLQPDAESLERRLEPLRKRYPDDPRLQTITQRLQEDDMIRQLENAVRRVAPPHEVRLRRYYREHPDKFTEPERQRVSVILLHVEPSAPQQAWETARTEAAGLVAQLKAGAEFTELARLHSADKSAERGGDMGYLHRGMLSEAAEQVIAKLALGEVSDPLQVLRGIAVFRVEERQAGRLRPFDDVHERASQLWIQEQGEQAWLRLKQDLRAASGVEVLLQDAGKPGSG